MSSEPVRQRTGIRLLVGGAPLRRVDFDGGRAVTLPSMRLREGEYVVGLAPASASQTYAVTGTCTTTARAGGSRVVRIGADGSTRVVPMPVPVGTVLVDGSHAWGVTFPDETSLYGSLLPFGGGARVRLPAGFWPDGVTDGVAVGSVGSAASGSGSLVLVDAATGGVRRSLGAGVTVAVGHGVVVWTAGCDPSTPEPCQMHRRSVVGGAVTDYRLPRPPGFTAGVTSPDRRLLAFTLERALPDPRYQEGHPIPPADIVLLHLDTGALEIVPGVEIPAKMSPALAFTADGHWLVMALNAGTTTRLLAWRHGLARPYESQALPGLVWGPPAILVLPAHAGP